MGVAIPIAVSAFPDELYQIPKSWAERAYPKLIHYNKVAKGGHFAAWEQPELFVKELRQGSNHFVTLRSWRQLDESPTSPPRAHVRRAIKIEKTSVEEACEP